MRPESQHSSSHDQNRPSSSSTQHTHTNHDRKDPNNPNRDSRSDHKLAHDHRKHNTGHDRKDGHSDRKFMAGDRKDSSVSVPHADKKGLAAVAAGKPYSRDGHSDRKDGHGDRREAVQRPHKEHVQPDRPDRQKHADHRHDKKPVPRETGDNAPIKMETNSDNVRSQTSSNTHIQKTKVEFELGADSANVKKETLPLPLPSDPAVANVAAQSGGDLRKSKSDLAINYKDYLKRKEQEKQERMEREKLEREKHRQRMEAEKLNKTFTEGTEREKKHRPPKLDMSLPAQIASNEHKHSERDNKERPYEVNIKSPVKPHHNITVKSPIKSSELKQPKLEITKVLLGPDKNGSDSCSVNINTDPNIKKMIDNIKQEPSVSHSKSSQDSVDSPRVKIKTEPNDSNRNKDRSETRTKVKVEAPDDAADTSIDLHPDHAAPPSVKIKELGYDPQNNGNVEPTPGSLKLSIKQESGGSGRSTPVISQLKSETGSGSNTPIRHKIVMPSSAENSPLKLKISTKGIADLDNSTEKYKSPHRHHKHKDKHKSHKHSKDKHREKHKKHRDKEGGGSSSSGTNGHPLKMSIKLSDIQGHSSSSNESWSVKHKHDKHKHAVSDTMLNRNSNADAERQQPWSMTDLLTNKQPTGASPARKRRRTPTVDTVNNDISHSHSKAAKTDSSHSHRLRRSSSSHSVVSMEMSDGDEGHGQENVIDQPQVVNQLQESLQQMIDQTKRNVLALQKQQGKKGSSKSSSATSVNESSRRPAVIDRQQSGFDLEGMMWSSEPPLPADSAPPLPRHPPSNVPPPPPPPPE